MPRCWLLRHGSSLANEDGASADSWTISITSAGQRQAREAAVQWSRIAPPGFCLFSSPMLRARQTAQHVQDLFPDVPFEIIEELHEFTPFDFSHLPPMRPIDRKPLMKSYWEPCDPELIGEGIGAESFARFKLRVEVALARLKSTDGYTLAVCHGGVIKMAELLLDPASRQLDAGQLMRAWIDKPTIQNCGMRELSFQMPEAHQGA